MATYKDKTYIIQINEIWAKQPFNASINVNAAPPNQSKIAHGFDYGEKPSHSTFNWIMYKVMANAVAVQQNGILPWHATIRYQQGAVTMWKAKGSTGMPKAYQALKGDNNTTANLDKEPVLSNIGVWWKQGIDDSDPFVKKAGNQYPGDTSGGEITGTIVINSTAQLIIKA